MEQDSLFDQRAGMALRDEAIKRVDKHADPEWKEVAYEAVVAVAEARREFTTDDVWEELRVRAPQAATHERRAMGAVMRRAAREGAVVRTGRFQESARPEAHRNPKMIWASQL